jgi:hypothetical protein
LLIAGAFHNGGPGQRNPQPRPDRPPGKELNQEPRVRHRCASPVSKGVAANAMQPTPTDAVQTNPGGSAPTFCDGRAQFDAATRARHAQLRLPNRHYLIHSRFFVLISSPLIWMCAIPIVLADLVGTLYMSVCFPIYGIPKVRRREYVAFDRHHLDYLNFFEKVNCEYCAYVNGILAYFTEIAARTEQHWCPIKHAHCAKCAHSRYRKFFEYGDAEAYRRDVEKVRVAYQDVEAADAPQKPR